MCGIGMIMGRDASPQKLDLMLAAQHHRGPDGTDSLFFSNEHLALGFNRLSIIDISDAGMQPMCSASGRYNLIFNGEIYNYKELRTIIGEYPYKSQSDSEVLLAAWEKWGPDCLSRLVGMFSFIIWDTKEKKVTIARDWVGIKPIYFAFKNKTLFACSEIKALLAAGISSTPDWQIWGDYFRYGVYNHDVQTFFKDIFALKPGHYITFGLDQVSTEVLPASQPYWRLGQDQDQLFSGVSEQDVSDELWDRLAQNVGLHLRSDVKLGLNLSGGMDSATLCLLMDQLSEEGASLSSFTIGYGEPRYDEIVYADLIPKSRDWDVHEVLFTASESAENFYDDVFSLEEPIGGVATQAYKKLHKYANEQGVKVLLEGQGIDELLGGYGYYKNLLSGETLETAGTPLFYQDNTRFLAPELIASSGPITESQLRDFDKPFSTNVENAMYADLFHRRVPRVLRMNDRLSMANSIELREPFLTADLAEYCFSIPVNYRVKPNQSKSVLKLALDKRVPEFARTCEAKRAVSSPQREWLRNDLKELTWDLLHSRSFVESGAFDVDLVHKTYQDYIKNGAENSFYIWQWMNFSAWLQVFR